MRKVLPWRIPFSMRKAPTVSIYQMCSTKDRLAACTTAPDKNNNRIPKQRCGYYFTFHETIKGYLIQRYSNLSLRYNQYLTGINSLRALQLILVCFINHSPQVSVSVYLLCDIKQTISCFDRICS